MLDKKLSVGNIYNCKLVLRDISLLRPHLPAKCLLLLILLIGKSWSWCSVVSFLVNDNTFSDKIIFLEKVMNVDIGTLKVRNPQSETLKLYQEL